MKELYNNIYNDIYNYLIDNNLISQNQSDFKLGDNLNSLNKGLEVRGELNFTNSQASQTESQKHLDLISDNKLNFNEHLKGVLDTISKTIGLIRKIHPILPRISLLNIYKTFVRTHLDYGDIIYDQTFNAPFHRKLESTQYSACLEITGTIRGTSYEKLNQGLGLGTLQSRRWFRKSCLFYKIVNNQSPSYLFDYIPSTDRIYNTRNAVNVPMIKSKQTFFKNSYILSTITECNKLDQDYVMQKATLYLESTY